MGSVLHNLIHNLSNVQAMYQSMRGVVLVARVNFGELRDEITMGAFLYPSSLLSFTQTIDGLTN